MARDLPGAMVWPELEEIRDNPARIAVEDGRNMLAPTGRPGRRLGLSRANVPGQLPSGHAA